MLSFKIEVLLETILAMEHGNQRGIGMLIGGCRTRSVDNYHL